MTTPDTHPEENASASELRLFALLQFPFLMGMLMAWNGWRLPNWSLVPLLGSATIALMGGVRPESIRWFYRLWMALVRPVGWLVSHLVLAIVYYLVVTPIGWGYRWGVRDPMSRKFDDQANSYWERRRQEKPASSYFHQF